MSKLHVSKNQRNQWTYVIQEKSVIKNAPPTHPSLNPTNTPRGFHVETTWKRPFPRRFNVESKWSVCREESMTCVFT